MKKTAKKSRTGRGAPGIDASFVPVVTAFADDQLVEWVVVGAGGTPWVELAREAYRFVKAARRPSSRRSGSRTRSA